MNWYIASLQISLIAQPPSQKEIRRCIHLISADDHEVAYRKAIELGGRATKEPYSFEGLYDLVFVSDVPEHRSELLWLEVELTAEALQTEVRPKEQLRAFASPQDNLSGWYLGSVVLAEVHDEGSHGDRVLAWINSYLIAAWDPEAAYETTVQIGREQQDPPGSHMCEGEKAHWEFHGVKDLIPLQMPPGDGSLLWCDDLEQVPVQARILPKKSDLSVFKWAAEQERKAFN